MDLWRPDFRESSQAWRRDLSKRKNETSLVSRILQQGQASRGRLVLRAAL